MPAIHRSWRRSGPTRLSSTRRSVPPSGRDEASGQRAFEAYRSSTKTKRRDRLPAISPFPFLRLASARVSGLLLLLSVRRRLLLRDPLGQLHLVLLFGEE